MDVQVLKKNAHSAEEINWMESKIKQFGRLTAMVIRSNNLTSDYADIFGKELTAVGMYSWARFVADPELKKKAYARQKERNALKSTSKPKSERKELEIFKSSQYIAYINRRICGFEDRVGLEKFMKENKILTEDIKLFKLLPVKVEYSVQIGD